MMTGIRQRCWTIDSTADTPPPRRKPDALADAGVEVAPADLEDGTPRRRIAR
jgi:hypothetical protein